MNSTALPPGRTCGQRWLSSPAASSVTRVTVPPVDRHERQAAAVIERGDDLPVLAPTRAAAGRASHKATGSPPASRVFFSFPPAKNPTHCPSGEKKGRVRSFRAGQRRRLGLIQPASRETARFRQALSRQTRIRVPSGERATRVKVRAERRVRPQIESEADERVVKAVQRRAAETGHQTEAADCGREQRAALAATSHGKTRGRPGTGPERAAASPGAFGNPWPVGA